MLSVEKMDKNGDLSLITGLPGTAYEKTNRS